MNLREYLEKVYKDLEQGNIDLEYISKVFTWIDDALTIIQDKQVDFAMIVESKDYDDYQNKMDLYIRTILAKKLGARYTYDGVKKEVEEWKRTYLLHKWEYDLLKEI